jgi:hypothetical protein
MKTAPQSSDGDKQAEPHVGKQTRSLQDAAAPLPLVR